MSEIWDVTGRGGTYVTANSYLMQLRHYLDLTCKLKQNMLNNLLFDKKKMQTTNLKSVKSHREDMSPAEIIKEVFTGLWKVGGHLWLLLHQNPLGWKKTTKPKNILDKKKVLPMKFKRQLLKLSGVHSLRKIYVFKEGHL